MNQTIRLMDPTRKGNVLVQFSTVKRDWREILAEALSFIHPSWASLSYMQSQLDIYENGEWIPYL